MSITRSGRKLIYQKRTRFVKDFFQKNQKFFKSRGKGRPFLLWRMPASVSGYGCGCLPGGYRSPSHDGQALPGLCCHHQFARNLGRGPYKDHPGLQRLCGCPGGLRDSAVAEQTASLTEVFALLIEGVEIMEAMSGKKSPGVIDSGAFRTILGSGLVHTARPSRGF